MKLWCFQSAALVVLATRGVVGQVSQNTSSPSGGSTTATVTSCEEISLTSINVRGAPNGFCVPRNTCNSNYIGSCPGANAIDNKGGLLASGSCCASLESTGEVGCVSLALVQSGAFQCLSHAGASDSAVVVDIRTATPPPTTTTPPPATTTPAPATTTPAPASNSSGGSSSASSDAGETPAPSTTTAPTEPETTAPSPTTPVTETPSPPATTLTPSVSPSPSTPASSSSSSSSGSSSGSTEPEAGVDPTITVTPSPRPEPATTTPPNPLDALQSLEPIPDAPSLFVPGTNVGGSSPSTSNTNPNTKPLTATGSSSTASSNSFGSALNDNVVLVLVLGTVASVAVVLGAFLLRRRRGAAAESSSTTPPTSSSRTAKFQDPNMPKMTLDGDDDLFDDLQFRQTNAFSPIFVQPTHSYVESRTPSNDRQSYFL